MSRTLDRSQGKFEAMPVSDGAPIVESGSNADGEWTRWADGTQICLSSGTFVYAQAIALELKNQPYPINFITRPHIVASITSTLKFGFRNATMWVPISIVTDELFSLELLSNDGGCTPGDITTTDLVATGRWK